MDEKKESEEGRSLGTLFIVATVVIVLVVGFGIFNYISEPFNTADKLKDLRKWINKELKERKQKG